MKTKVENLKVGDVFKMDGDEHIVVSFPALSTNAYILNLSSSTIVGSIESLTGQVVDVVDVSKRVVVEK